ncbi:MAG: hypothetical protein RL497_2704 [Pseudomonadota bacterium]|jgi:hypothetical protein
MACCNRSFIAVAFVLPLLILGDLFTAEITQPDDSTSFLVLKKSPSTNNKYTITSPDHLNHYWVITSDENGFAGRDIYHFLMHLEWHLFLMVLLAALYYFVNSRKNNF